MSRQQFRHPDRHKLPSVVLGITTAENVHAYTHASITGSILQNPGLVAGEIVKVSGPRVAENRNSIIKDFFRHDSYQQVEWLIFIDADMVFEPDAIPRLLRQADPVTRPIIGGLCFAGGYDKAQTPVVWSLTAEGEYERVSEYPKGLCKFDATGAAFLLIHQSALMKIGEQFATLPNGNPSAYPWFVEGVTSKSGRPMSEDVAFCARANALGIPLYVDTSLVIGHVKPRVLNESTLGEEVSA